MRLYSHGDRHVKKKFQSACIQIPEIKLLLAVKIGCKVGRRVAFDSHVNELSNTCQFYKIN